MSHLLVTIDVECDKSRTWRTADPLRFRAVVDAIPNLLQPLFTRFGIRPTYLLSPEVIADDACCAVLRCVADAELGTHLHGEYIGPAPVAETLAGSMAAAMQGDYPPAIEQAKLAALTALFTKRLGSAPTAFRAGRYGVGPHSGRFLYELGYRVDSSVTPHLCWTNPRGQPQPDFRGCPERPYYVGPDHDLFTVGDSPLLEVPVTVLAKDVLPEARPVWPGAQAGEPVWFRPFYADERTLVDIVRHVANPAADAHPPRPLVMMFHNIELVADASPYTRSVADVRRYVDMLAIAFEAAVTAGFLPATLSEYQRFFERQHRRDARTR